MYVCVCTFAQISDVWLGRPVIQPFSSCPFMQCKHTPLKVPLCVQNFHDSSCAKNKQGLSRDALVCVFFFVGQCLFYATVTVNRVQLDRLAALYKTLCVIIAAIMVSIVILFLSFIFFAGLLLVGISAVHDMRLACETSLMSLQKCSPCKKRGKDKPLASKRK